MALYFKYMPLDRWKDVLGRGRIRFTPPGAFNDPFEMPSLKIKEVEAEKLSFLASNMMQTTEMLDALSHGTFSAATFTPPYLYRAARNREARASLTEAEKRERVRKLDEATEHLGRIDFTYGILSLTAKSDNLLLWAHYADEHRGIAIGIDASVLERRYLDSGRDKYQMARNVTYSHTRPRIPVEKTILAEHFYVKSPEWEYEHEYRIVRHLKDRTEELPLQPFAIHLYELPPDAVREVVFGSRVTEQRRKEVIDGIRLNAAYSHVAFLKARISRESFQLEFDPL